MLLCRLHFTNSAGPNSTGDNRDANNDAVVIIGLFEGMAPWWAFAGSSRRVLPIKLPSPVPLDEAGAAGNAGKGGQDRNGRYSGRMGTFISTRLCRKRGAVACAQFGHLKQPMSSDGRSLVAMRRKMRWPSVYI
jgi:hypothetical protein